MSVAEVIAVAGAAGRHGDRALTRNTVEADPNDERSIVRIVEHDGLPGDTSGRVTSATVPAVAGR